MDINERSLLVPRKLTEDKKTGLSVVYASICIIDIFGVFPLIVLPYAVIQCGFFGIPLVILVCGVQIYTAILLGRCWLLLERIDPSISSKSRYPYAALAEAAYGKTMAACITLLLNISIFGGSIPNLIVASQNLQLLGEKISSNNIEISYCCWIIIMAVVLCPFLWLGSPKDIKHLSTVSGFIVFSVFCLILFNIFTSEQQDNSSSILQKEFPEGSYPLWESLLSAYGILVFQFDVHPSLLTIHIDMKRKQDIGKAIAGAYFISLTMSGIISIVAGITMSDRVLPNILDSLNLTASVHFAAFLVALQLGLTSAICNNTMYQQVEDTIGISKDFSWSRCAVRTILTIITVLVAESVPRFDLVMSLVGGALIGPLILIFPPMFYLSIVSQQNFTYRLETTIANPFEDRMTSEKRTRGEVYFVETPRTISIVECFICIMIIALGIFLTVLSTYYSFINNMRYLSFYPPCIYNVTM